MADDNKPWKYVRYAIGEIVLVVIGILIALQVNNWNEKRKFDKEGIEIKQELYDEFSDNRVVLAERIKSLESANEHIEALFYYMDSPIEIVQTVNMDSIIGFSLKYGNFNPSNSTIQELIGSGRLNLISNKSLKKNLYQWLQLLKDADEDFKNQDQQASTLLIPYLYKRVSMRNINHYGGIRTDQKSTLFTGDYDVIFNDLEFENLYEGKLFWNRTLLNHYKNLDTLASEIMKQSNGL
ncbi:DUF6090 family protein [Lutimonas vermicola]|uniref:DUF6090 family protein n=1 Tax=Lutimonas vermicola TaxID=414288 RepID=A0ABU9L1E8_9FLAO